MKKLRLIWKFLNYYLKGRSKYYIHSPFVYQLVTEVILKKGEHPAFKDVEKLRKALLNSEQVLEVEDFGAGSHKGLNKQRKVSDIARYAAKPKKFAQLLFRFADHFKPAYMLEFGSSLGISTLYQALPGHYQQFISMEGSSAIAKMAQAHVQQFNLQRVDIRKGNFDKILDDVLKEFPQLDYVFFDGNHQKEPTLRYFEQCLPLAHNNSLFVFDDIHWSDEMESAWETIKAHPEVQLTIDLFFIGLVFFRKEQAKQHFVIRF